MQSYRLAGLVLFAAVIMGCHHNRKPQPAPPATADTIREIRESYQQIDPSARVGLVIAVVEPDRLVAIGDIPVNEFNNGDVLVLMDSNRHVIGVGTVITKTADALHLRYEPRGAEGRAPQVGDLAVRTKGQ